MATAALITKPTFTLADRLRIQQDRIRNMEYTKIGKLTTVVMERQISTRGMSQSQPRWANPEQAKIHERDKNFQPPFSEWQANAWVQLTLDWLHHRNGPLLAISRDRNDLLLPFGMNPLPDIPDPIWIPKLAGDTAPRIEQNLEARACGQIRDRRGRMFLIFQPLTELCVCIGSGKDSGFGKIKCMTDPADCTHSALLVDPHPIDRDGRMQAHFVGGSFQAGF